MPLWRRMVDLAIPIAVLVWRLAWDKPSAIWRDWVVYGSLYWIFTHFGRRGKAWTPVTVLLMLWFLAIYLSRQLNPALDTIRLAW